MSAIDDLNEYLDEDETVVNLVFGAWGWDGFGEPEPNPVPKSMRGKILTLDDAAEFMRTWSFDGGYGSPDCYATYIWTNTNCIWVTQYDGATFLTSIPRNPVDIMPEMPGG